MGGNSSKAERISGIVAGREPRDIWNACTDNTSTLPFCNEDLSVDERLHDLVKRVKLGDVSGELTARQSK